MNKLLLSKEIPYLLTILLILLGFQLNLLIEDSKSTPLIEYKYTIKDEIKNGNSVKKIISCRIRNLSSEESFKNLSFVFLHDIASGGKLFDPGYIVVSPSSIQGIKVDQAQNLTVNHIIGHLQPDQEYELLFTSILDKKKTVYPKIFLDTNETVRLIESSPFTFLIKNYFELNILVCIFWIILIIAYVLFFNKKTKSN